MLQPALRKAKKVIEEAERISLSERDSLMVLKLLEKPPTPNARLRRALASYRKRNERPGLARGDASIPGPTFTRELDASRNGEPDRV